MSKAPIQKYFELGIYKEKDLDVFVKAGYISEEEKKEIVK